MKKRTGLYDGESIYLLQDGVSYLFRNDSLRVFRNMATARRVAERTGGEAYRSTFTRRYMVRYVGEAKRWKFF